MIVLNIFFIYLNIGPRKSDGYIRTAPVSRKGLGSLPELVYYDFITYNEKSYSHEIEEDIINTCA